MLAACAMVAGLLRYVGGSFSLGKHELPFLALGFSTIPLFYKILWTFAGVDTIGMQAAGLKLVDFDGNAPSHGRRYQRLAGGIISLLAAGVGLIWAFFDEDRLTWHDHMSNTFPTISDSGE